MSAAVTSAPPIVVSACVAPLVSNTTGKVPVVPVGIACASRKTINPLNGAERNGWLRNEKRTLVVPTVTPDT